MGGSKTQVVSPTPPPAPSMSSSINDYVAALPQLYQAQLDYAPKEAQQQIDLFKQYGGQIADLQKQYNESLYPGTSAIQEQLAAQAQQGYNNGLTEDLKNLYRNEYTAQVGASGQAGSGIGADYVAKNLLSQDLAYRQYNQNLGLTLANRQPLAMPQATSFTNQLGGINAGNALNYTSGNYGSQLQYGKPFTIPGQSSNAGSYIGAAGGLLSGIGGLGALGGAAGIKGLFG